MCLNMLRSETPLKVSIKNSVIDSEYLLKVMLTLY